MNARPETTTSKVAGSVGSTHTQTVNVKPANLQPVPAPTAGNDTWSAQVWPEDVLRQWCKDGGGLNYSGLLG